MTPTEVTGRERPLTQLGTQPTSVTEKPDRGLGVWKGRCAQFGMRRKLEMAAVGRRNGKGESLNVLKMLVDW